MRIKGTYLLVLVAMCGLIASGVGLVTNVAGLFFDPVAAEIGVSKGQVSLMLTICNICFALGGMVAPPLMRARNPKPLTIGATAALVASTAALSLCHSIVPMYVLCVVRGLAAGVVGMVFATTVLGNWFVAGLGLVTSIAFGCSGIAGAVFSPVMSGIIAAAGWRVGYMVMAALTVVLNLPAILFLPAVDPAVCGRKALGAAEGEASAATAGGGKGTADTAGAISGVLFALVLAYAIICSGITALPQHFPGLAQSLGLGATGATMLSLCMIANTGGKVLLGVLVDRIGARLSILGYCVAVLVGVVLMLFVHGPVSMLVAAVLYGLCYALATVGISMTARDVFGDANYTRVYPTFQLGGNFANAIFSSVIGFMYDFSGGYVLPLWVMLLMVVASAATIVVAYARKAA
ncbi:MAG: MFS transporter [Coriobacteriales bacterium]|nr:MFS transporter [Coriobacteriales bacterium]